MNIVFEGGVKVMCKDGVKVIVCGGGLSDRLN